MTKTELINKMSNIEDIEALIEELSSAEEDTEVLEILSRYNLELRPDDVRSLLTGEEELSADALEDVVGGCKCKAPLKRLINNALTWLFKTATGIKVTCLDCGH